MDESPLFSGAELSPGDSNFLQNENCCRRMTTMRWGMIFVFSYSDKLY